MKRQHWYAFGKSPAVIAASVGALCERAKRHVVKTDFTTFEGTIGNPMRELERITLARAFHPRPGEALEAHKRGIGAKVVGRHGTVYGEGLKNRHSGRQETAVFNSLGNAFSSYAAFREMGMSHSEAYAALGQYGGDDGLTADVDPAVLTAVCSELGLIIKAETVRRGERGVDFLSRIFGPDVWSGDPNSHCDLRRQLSKLHLTGHKPESPSSKFAAKIGALAMTDRGNPLIRDLCKWFDEQFPGERPTNVSEESYWTSTEEWVQAGWPCEPLDWIAADVLSEFPAYPIWRERLSECVFPELPLLEYPAPAPRPPAEVVENGTMELILAPASPAPKPEEEEDEELEVRRLEKPIEKEKAPGKGKHARKNRKAKDKRKAKRLKAKTPNAPSSRSDARKDE